MYKEKKGCYASYRSDQLWNYCYFGH